mgnify:CR=1 FL=1
MPIKPGETNTFLQETKLENIKYAKYNNTFFSVGDDFKQAFDRACDIADWSKPDMRVMDVLIACAQFESLKPYAKLASDISDIWSLQKGGVELLDSYISRVCDDADASIVQVANVVNNIRSICFGSETASPGDFDFLHSSHLRRMRSLLTLMIWILQGSNQGLKGGLQRISLLT